MLDYAYNFKNPIRFFIHISHMALPRPIDEYGTDDLSWTSPFVFRIHKQPNTYRTLRIPNVLNFRVAYRIMSSAYNFRKIDRIGLPHKRMTANIDTGDFRIGAYAKQLSMDMTNLSIYDILIKVDIQSYYASLYTHYFIDQTKERYITNMNQGATNGLIMGNYISLYWAEMMLAKISKEFSKEISRMKLNIQFSYFSDDFYIFCNNEDKQTIIHLFETILERFELVSNIDKLEVYDYETYNAVTVIDRYFNRIMQDTKARRLDSKKGLYFINQLVYRASKLPSAKLKNTLVLTYFKSEFFQKCDLSKYTFHDSEYHQLCWLYKLSPESIIHSLRKFISSNSFETRRIARFLQTRFEQSIKTPFHDEQLFFFIGLMIIKRKDIAEKYSSSVIATGNQPLIAYFLKYRLLSSHDITYLKHMNDERFWFQNYHLILYDNNLYGDLDNSIADYLMPKYAIATRKRDSYLDFYRTNLKSKREMIVDMPMLQARLNQYYSKRHSEQH